MHTAPGGIAGPRGGRALHAPLELHEDELAREILLGDIRKGFLYTNTHLVYPPNKIDDGVGVQKLLSTREAIFVHQYQRSLCPPKG